MENSDSIFYNIAKVFGFVDGDPEYIYVGVEKVQLYLDPRKTTGQTRFVYRWGDYIIKVDDPNEASQCRREVLLWEANHKNDILLPILDWGFFINDDGEKVFWVIQKFIEIDEDEKDYPDGLFKKCSRLRIYDIDDGRNWSFFNGSPVVYDYGV